MNKSTFILLAGVAGLCAAGCSSPAEDGGIPDPPSSPPPGFLPGAGQGGTGQQQVGQAGSGGTGALPTGGTGGTGAATAGTGGSAMVTAGAGGAGGAGGGSSVIPTGAGNIITHDAEGWVAGSSNGLGIQGSFYTISDADGTPPGVTTVALGDLATPTRMCVSGTASAVPDSTGYAQFWGGGLALNLADAGGGMGAGAWSPGTVTGFSFTVSGPTIPDGLRFNATGAGGATTYCGNLAGGANTVNLSSLTLQCYNTPPGAMMAGGTQLESIQWQVVTVLTDPTPFDFCIENLTALTAP